MKARLTPTQVKRLRKAFQNVNDVLTELNQPPLKGAALAQFEMLADTRASIGAVLILARTTTKKR